jgi:SAM-dependent methyltransferase
MHPIVFEAFDRLCRERGAGGSVLEVGAVATPDTLLMLPALGRATERVGVNIEGPFEFDGFTVHRGNANEMAFPDRSFDTVLCNAVLEHDPFFWKSLSEMRRVLKPGGLLIVGVPAFDERPALRWSGLLRFLPLPRAYVAAWRASTLTLHLHNYPGDYYRFSAQACRAVLLEGLVETSVQTVISPPRVIGVGVKPRGWLAPPAEERY